MSSADGKYTLAGVFSGIEENTEDADGNICTKQVYEMYFTPTGHYTKWINNVMRFCDDTPSKCFGGSVVEEPAFFTSDIRPVLDNTASTAAPLRASISQNNTPNANAHTALCKSKGGVVASSGGLTACDMPDGISYPLASLRAFNVFR